jgi:uncharacterized membrane protein YkoI
VPEENLTKIVKKTLLASAMMIPIVASAANLNCSIKASKVTKTADVQAMAKISADDAKKAALGAVNVAGATIAKGELEVEDGCLVYSYDVKVPGKSGAQEVYVDAGNGKVIKSVHETTAKEAVEKTKK